MNKRKYGYIVTDCVSPTDEASDYKLLPQNVATRISPGSDLLWSDAVRVDITNIKVEKYDCDDYSTTCGSIKIKDLNPKIFVRKNFKWIEDKELTKKWLNGELIKNCRRDFYQKIKKYIWTYRGFFTQEGFLEYKKYNANLLKECRAYVLEWAKSHYSEEDSEVVKKWLVDLETASEIHLFRKVDWKYEIESVLKRKMEHYKITDEIFNTTKDKKLKDCLIKHEITDKEKRIKQVYQI